MKPLSCRKLHILWGVASYEMRFQIIQEEFSKIAIEESDGYAIKYLLDLMYDTDRLLAVGLTIPTECLEVVNPNFTGLDVAYPSDYKHAAGKLRIRVDNREFFMELLQNISLKKPTVSLAFKKTDTEEVKICKPTRPNKAYKPNM